VGGEGAVPFSGAPAGGSNPYEHLSGFLKYSGTPPYRVYAEKSIHNPFVLRKKLPIVGSGIGGPVFDNRQGLV